MTFASPPGRTAIEHTTRDPPVTALDLHPGQVATAAIELLVARIERAEVMHPRVVHASLNVRASTNPSAGRGAPPS